jgi:hypothetical protein
MMKLSIATASLLFAGVAGAQPAAREPAKPASPAQPTAQPLKPATPATPGAPGTPAKTDPKAAAGTPTTPPKPPEPPKPPAQVAELAAAMVGTWRCKGEEVHLDGTKETVTATATIKLDMNKFWLVETQSIKSKQPFTITTYTTFDSGSNKWRRLGVDSRGNSYIGTSDGPKEKKIDWNLDVMGMMGAAMLRDHIDTSDPKAGSKITGEVSVDKGKTWNKVVELTCKK